MKLKNIGISLEDEVYDDFRKITALQKRSIRVQLGMVIEAYVKKNKHKITGL